MKLNRNEIEKCFRWMAKQPESEQLVIAGDQKRLYRVILNNRRKNGEDTTQQAEINFQALVEAIFKRYRIQNRRLDNRNDLNVLEENRIKTDKQIRKAKTAKVREKISTDLFLTIKKLRKEGYSWMKISKYIAKYHKRIISKSYLCTVYTEMQESEGTEEPG
jgi:hypothetical protein